MDDFNLDNVTFEAGKNFRLKYSRTTVDFTTKDGWFYEIKKSKKGVMPTEGPWVTHKDLPDTIRSYGHWEGTGRVVSCIDDGTILYKGPSKPKVTRKKK